MRVREPTFPGSAAITLRTGGGGERAHDDVLAVGIEQRELGDQRHPDARRHQPLHGLVVVALERHVRLEPRRMAAAHHVARAGARLRSLHPRLAAQLLKAQRALVRQPVAAGGARGTAVLQQLDPLEALLLRPPRNEQQREIGSPVRRRGAISCGSPSASVSSTSG